jgi:hypothetical protein
VLVSFVCVIACWLFALVLLLVCSDGSKAADPAAAGSPPGHV